MIRFCLETSLEQTKNRPRTTRAEGPGNVEPVPGPLTPGHRFMAAVGPALARNTEQAARNTNNQTLHKPLPLI
jgi:hypothetical protein